MGCSGGCILLCRARVLTVEAQTVNSAERQLSSEECRSSVVISLQADPLQSAERFTATALYIVR